VISKWRKRAKIIMSNFYVVWLIVILIVLYTILIFSALIIEDVVANEDKELTILGYFEIIEIIILSLFFVEIFLNAYG